MQTKPRDERTRNQNRVVTMGSLLRSRNALKDRKLGPDGAQQKVQAVRLSKAATITLYKNTVPLTSH